VVDVTLGPIAIAFALIAVVSLNVVLLAGAAGHDLDVSLGLFRVAVVILDISILVSSILLGLTFARLKRGVLSALFLSNVGVFIVAAGVRMSGFSFRPAALFVTDLYWLNLYLVVLARHWRDMARPSV
jgi:hypothetical protein